MAPYLSLLFKADRPMFAALAAADMQDGGNELRRIPVPPHRYTPLKDAWMQVFLLIVF